MKLPTDICLICFEPLDKDYRCTDNSCRSKFEYEFNEVMGDFYLGSRSNGYIVEYRFNDDGTFQCAKVFARPYSKHICDFLEPFDFQSQSESQIIQRIEKLKVFK